MPTPRQAPRRRDPEPEPEYRDDAPPDDQAPRTRSAMVPPADGQTWVLAGLEFMQRELVAHGIGKHERNQEQKYQFRGIDTIMGEVSGLLVRARLIVSPRVIARSTDERETSKGYKRVHTHLEVEYTFRSLVDGSTLAVVVCGEGTDSADKGTSKAMSMAYKAAMIQTFSIPINGQDVDGDAGVGYEGEADEAPPPDEAPRINARQIGEVMRRAKELNIKPERICAMYQLRALDEMTTTQLEDCGRQFDATERRRAAKQQPTEE